MANSANQGWSAVQRLVLVMPDEPVLDIPCGGPIDREDERPHLSPFDHVTNVVRLLLLAPPPIADIRLLSQRASRQRQSLAVISIES